MRKRVAVLYVTGDEKPACIHGDRTIILVEADDEVDVTAVNMDGCDDVEEVLIEALETVRRNRLEAQTIAN